MAWFQGGSQTSSTETSLNAFESEQAVLDILGQHGAHAAAGRGQGHFHIDTVAGGTEGAEVTIVNEAQVELC